MKKHLKVNYTIVALLLVFTVAGIPSILPSLLHKKAEVKIAQDGIVKSETDERGLTSVVYVQDGKEWALDYADPKQIDSIKNLLSRRGCWDRPCTFGQCKGGYSVGGGDYVPCTCCAADNKGYCLVHKPNQPVKP